MAERFHIVHHLGVPSEAVLPGGTKIFREEKLFFPRLGRFVICAPYDNHFVYDDKKGKWTPMCTCGSPAGIVGYNAYKGDASPSDTGELIVCLSHAQYGRHANGDT